MKALAVVADEKALILFLKEDAIASTALALEADGIALALIAEEKALAVLAPLYPV